MAMLVKFGLQLFQIASFCLNPLQLFAPPPPLELLSEAASDVDSGNDAAKPTVQQQPSAAVPSASTFPGRHIRVSFWPPSHPSTLAQPLCLGSGEVNSKCHRGSKGARVGVDTGQAS